MHKVRVICTKDEFFLNGRKKTYFIQHSLKKGERTNSSHRYIETNNSLTYRSGFIKLFVDIIREIMNNDIMMLLIIIVTKF